MPLVKKSIVLNNGQRPVPMNPARGVPQPTSPRLPAPSPATGSNARTPKVSNPSLRPSLVSSDPTISLGSDSLDAVLIHGGIPLGTILLIEENGTTDFASVILRGVCAQGLFHSRQKIAPTKCIVVGVDAYWVNDLPGDKKERKSSKPVSQGVENNLKIAWRYAPKQQQQAIDELSASSSIDNTKYRTEFDFTSKISPKPNYHEIEQIAPNLQSNFLVESLKRLDKSINQAEKEGAIVRVVIPSLFNPMNYSLEVFDPSHVVPFFQGLRLLASKYAQTAAFCVSCSTALVETQAPDVLRWIELLSDTVIQLDAFPEDSPFATTKSNSDKEQTAQGLLHILKVATLSNRGMMLVRQSEYSFRAGRRQFEVQNWSIPVEDVDDQDNKVGLDF